VRHPAGRADARGDAQDLPVPDVNGVASEGYTQAFGEGVRRGGCTVDQEADELLAGVPHQDVGLPDHAEQRGGDGLQDPVPTPWL
jgi:hypothetical protein